MDPLFACLTHTHTHAYAHAQAHALHPPHPYPSPPKTNFQNPLLPARSKTDPRQGRNPSRSTTTHLCRQAARRRSNPLGLQYSKGEHFALGLEVEGWDYRAFVEGLGQQVQREYRLDLIQGAFWGSWQGARRGRMRR